jgi:hypothetical protein
VLSQLFVRLIAKRRGATLTAVVLKFSFGENNIFLFRKNNVLPFVTYLVPKSALLPQILLFAVATLVIVSFGDF